MKCPHCHAEDQEGLYCAKCGEPLNESVSDLTRVMPAIKDLHDSAESDAANSAHDLGDPATAFENDNPDAPTNDTVGDDITDTQNTTCSDEEATDSEDDDTSDEEATNVEDGDISDEEETDTEDDDISDEEVTDSEDDDTSDEEATDAENGDISDEEVTDTEDGDTSDEKATDAEDSDISDEEVTDAEDSDISDEEADNAEDSNATDEEATNTEDNNDSDEEAFDDIDDSSIEDTFSDEEKAAKRKKILTIVALVGGITLAALAAFYLFDSYFGNSGPVDPTTQIKNADVLAPDTSLAEDNIVGHWRHYNSGGVIEKIGTGRYRWTIDDKVYPLVFKDNKYTIEDESGSIYTFVLVNADRIQLIESKDANGGLITNPVFESGFIAGRVAQDGTMTKNLAVNTDAFNIAGRTYADLAGTYGPGSLSVIGDEQYIIFRGDGGNFAVQFTGETVPLQKKTGDTYKATLLDHKNSADYKVVPLTEITPVTPNDDVTYPTTDSTTDSGDITTEPTLPDTSSGTTTMPNTTTDDTTNADTTTNTDTDTNTTTQEDKKYKVEIPDMPTFPSNSAVATGVVWADLGFVIKNAPDTLSVNDLSAVLGVALEVGEAPVNESGFNFYGISDGYFAGTYGINNHSYYISGYGKDALSAEKTILFIEQIS